MCLSMIPHQFARGYWEHGTMAIPSEGCSGLEAFLAVGHVWCGPVSAIRELPAPCKQQLARQQQQCSPGTQCRQHLSHLGSSIQGPQPLPVWPHPESAAQRAEQTLGLVHS